MKSKLILLPQLGNHKSDKVTEGGSQNKQQDIGKADSDGGDSRGWDGGDTEEDTGHVRH